MLSKKDNHGDAVLEASRTLIGEAFLVFVYEGRQEELPGLQDVVVFGTRCMQKGNERDWELDFGMKEIKPCELQQCPNNEIHMMKDQVFLC